MLASKQKNVLVRLAKLVIPEEGLRRVPPEDIIANILTYVGEIRSPMAVKLGQLLKSLPDIPVGRGTLEVLMGRRSPLRDIFVPVLQVIYLGFYGDPRSYPLVGYTPFEDRHPDRAGEDHPSHPSLPIRDPDKVIETDVCIIGSGAAGGVLAYVLSKERKRDVLVLEKGPYVHPEAFTNREIDMVSGLYLDGGMQLTLDFVMHVLQGSCVGGSTTVNNAICFQLKDIPEGEGVLDEWERRGATLDRDALYRSYDEVARVIEPAEIPEDRMNLGARLLEEGYRAWSDKSGVDLQNGRFLLNFKECLGAGYCNIGCRYNRKLSTLVSYLPKAAETGRLQILPDCQAERIVRRGHRAVEVKCLWTGDTKPRTIRIRANTIVVAAGAVASSALLTRSWILNPAIGRGISFNAGGLIHAQFDEKDYPDGVNSYNGIQMCNYIRGPEGKFYIESLFNPPMALALSMPGWFEEHFENMRRSRFFATAGVIVGTEPVGELETDILLGGHKVNFAIDHDTGQDWRRVVSGLRMAAEFYLAAGAKRVLPSASIAMEIKRKKDLAKLRDLKPREFYHGSSHPQGGNAMTGDAGEGAVNGRFQVIDEFGRPIENLYVCDASVFPTSLGINPQWTIMAIADYAARTGRIE
jgi:choline dehydrogenase-like flavoprotein